MIDIDVNKQAYDRIMRTIQQLAKNMEDLKPVWKDFSNYYPLHFIQKSFETRGAAMGVRWSNFNPKYLKWKKKHYSGKPMLVQTGQLKRDATENIKTKISKDNMQFIINNELATIHQLNKKKPREFAMKRDKTLPSRAILWLMERMYKYIKGNWK